MADSKHFVLISCGKTKHNSLTTAADLYRGALFVKSLAYARTLAPAGIFVLSAKHGLLDLEDEVAPYEMTMNKMPVQARSIWAEMVLNKLKCRTDIDRDHFTFLAGSNYRRYLQHHLAQTSAPLEGLGLGQQLAWLSR